MKQIIILLILIVAGSQQTDAQLLKKIKDKAAKVMEPKKPDANSSNETSDTNPGKTTENADNSNSNSNTKTPAAPPTNGSVVFTLGSDENLLYDESKILTKNNKVSYSFVVQNKKYEYFLIEDGNRTGPFKEAPIKSLNQSDESEDGASSSNNDEVSLGDKKDPIAIQYSKTINGKLFIVFNNKNYGPYDFVSKMIVSPDKKQFFAAATIGSQSPMMAKMGMGNTYIVNEGMLKQKAGAGSSTMPMKFSVSDGFKHCMVTVMDQTSQKIFTVTSANKQEEGSMADMYSGGGSKSFVSDNGDIISIPSQSPTQVMVNGKEAASFKVPITSMSRLFLTPDVSKSVYYEKGKIYRADGTEESLTGVIFPKVVTVGNETAVYYFKMFKTETGTKDVYLCKKVI
ncbi:MAG: hypothetical protein RIS73_1874 [Bacteroidota bacterium]